MPVLTYVTNVTLMASVNLVNYNSYRETCRSLLNCFRLNTALFVCVTSVLHFSFCCLQNVTFSADVTTAMWFPLCFRFVSLLTKFWTVFIYTMIFCCYLITISWRISLCRHYMATYLVAIMFRCSQLLVLTIQLLINAGHMFHVICGGVMTTVHLRCV